MTAEAFWNLVTARRVTPALAAVVIIVIGVIAGAITLRIVKSVR